MDIIQLKPRILLSKTKSFPTKELSINFKSPDDLLNEQKFAENVDKFSLCFISSSLRFNIDYSFQFDDESCNEEDRNFVNDEAENGDLSAEIHEKNMESQQG